MSTCSCAPAHRTSVAFAHGIVMQRCRAHDLQTWTHHGRPTDAGTVRTLLKDLFVEQRGTRSGMPRHVPRIHRAPVVRTPAPEDAIAAVLRAHGVEGTWSIA